MHNTGRFVEQLEDRRLFSVNPFAPAGQAAAPAGVLQRRGSFIFRQENLVSNEEGQADGVDANLDGAWGLTLNDDGELWVANAATGVGTVYSRRGVPVRFVPAPGEASQVRVVRIPGGASAAVAANDGGEDFRVLTESRGFFTPARLIFATTDGRLAGWSAAANARRAVVAVDNSATDASYTGLSLGNFAGERVLYVANFGQGRVELFDTRFRQLNLRPTAFSDRRVPDDYAPYNVQSLRGRIYVSYAPRADADLEQGAPGGYIGIFSTNGRLLHHIENPNLNAPYGLSLAPDRFGKFGNKLLVGNSGDGRILAFSRNRGQFSGLLRDKKGRAVVIENLRSLQKDRLDDQTLYFTAGGEEGAGLLGTLRLAGRRAVS